MSSKSRPKIDPMTVWPLDFIRKCFENKFELSLSFTEYCSLRDYESCSHEEALGHMHVKLRADAEFAGIADLFKTYYDSNAGNTQGRQVPKYPNPHTLSYGTRSSSIAVANQVYEAVYVTGGQSGFKSPDALDAVRSFVEQSEKGISWVDCTHFEGREPRARFLEEVYGVHPDLEEERARPDSFMFYKKPLEQLDFYVGGQNGFVNTGPFVSYDNFARSAKDQLENLIRFSNHLRQQNKPVVFQCAEGKDRSVYCAAMYTVISLIQNTGNEITWEDFINCIHAVRCRATVVSTLEHLPWLLLGFIDDKDKVFTFFSQQLGIRSGSEEQILEVARGNLNRLTICFFSGDNHLFAESVRKLQCFILGKPQSFQYTERLFGGGGPASVGNNDTSQGSQGGEDSSVPPSQNKAAKKPIVTCSDVWAFSLLLLVIPIIPFVVQLCRRNSQKQKIWGEHLGDLFFKNPSSPTDSSSSPGSSM